MDTLTRPRFGEERPKVIAISVTYGNRFSLAQRMVAAALRAGVSAVVLVDNASEDPSARALKELERNLDGALIVLRQEENRGSAGGYATGILHAVKEGAEFLWLLDDDNAPLPDALERLWSAYLYLGADPRNVLFSHRLAPAFGKDQPAKAPISLRPNAFLNFHFLNVLPYLLRRVSWIGQKGNVGSSFPIQAVDHALYGGLFFHRFWVEKIGLPREDFFVYVDDLEYTLRFAQAGGRLYLCALSRIEDLQPSWNHKGNPWLAPDADEKRLFYIVRNGIWLSKRRATFLPFFLANLGLFLGFLTLSAMRHRVRPALFARRLGLFWRAFQEGWHGRLGKIR